MIRGFHRMLAEARRLLGLDEVEIKTKLKSMAGQEKEGQEGLELCAGAWRRMIRAAEPMLEASHAMAMEAAVVAELTDLQARQRKNADVSSKMGKVVAEAGPVYSQFAFGRSQLYSTAAIWSISTSRSSPKRWGGDLAKMTDAQLATALKEKAGKLVSSGHQLLGEGARVVRMFLSAADPRKGDVDEHLRGQLIGMGLDFRDAVSYSLFYRVNSVIKRCNEISQRASTAQRFEDRTPLVEQLPWWDDPEIGDGE